MSDQELTKRWLKQRRSQRIEMNVSVVVHRPAKYGPLFYESTQTLVINAHGALIPLADKVAPSGIFYSWTWGGYLCEVRAGSTGGSTE